MCLIDFVPNPVPSLSTDKDVGRCIKAFADPYAVSKSCQSAPIGSQNLLTTSMTAPPCPTKGKLQTGSPHQRARETWSWAWAWACLETWGEEVVLRIIE